MTALALSKGSTLHWEGLTPQQKKDWETVLGELLVAGSLPDAGEDAIFAIHDYRGKKLPRRFVRDLDFLMKLTVERLGIAAA